MGRIVEEFQGLPTLPLANMNASTGLLGQNLSQQANTGAVTGAGMQRVTNNTNTQNDDHTVNYHIERITLECSELTQEQSRRVLYNALDGLYGRGT